MTGTYRVAGNEQTSERYHGRASLGCVLGVVLVQSEVSHAGEDHETTEHPQGARDQGTSPSELFYNVRACVFNR